MGSNVRCKTTPAESFVEISFGFPSIYSVPIIQYSRGDLNFEFKYPQNLVKNR